MEKAGEEVLKKRTTDASAQHVNKGCSRNASGYTIAKGKKRGFTKKKRGRGGIVLGKPVPPP